LDDLVVMDAANFLQLLLSGILLGGIYAMVAAGLALCFGVLGLLNLAHGSVLVLAAYVYQAFEAAFPNGSILGFLLIPCLFGLAGFVAFTPLLGLPYRRSPEEFLTPALLITLGLALVLEELVSILWGHSMAGVEGRLSPIQLGPLSLSGSRVLILLMMVVLSLALHTWLKRTDSGRRLRALAQDHLAATVVGISPVRTTAVAFNIATGLSAIAGLFYVTLFTVTPHLGLPLTVKALFLIVVSGRGSMVAPLAGGLLLGVLETLVAGLMGPSPASIIALAFLLACLCFRPGGLFAKGYVPKSV
jgi:branched-chain amino acid transport system permease protein